MAYHRSDQQIERSLIMAKDRLITPGYCFILAANFLLYFGFWLLIPVLPFYLSEFFQAGNSTIGIVLSCYTVAALCIVRFPAICWIRLPVSRFIFSLISSLC